MPIERMTDGPRGPEVSQARALDRPVGAPPLVPLEPGIPTPTDVTASRRGFLSDSIKNVRDAISNIGPRKTVPAGPRVPTRADQRPVPAVPPAQPVPEREGISRRTLLKAGAVGGIGLAATGIEDRMQGPLRVWTRLYNFVTGGSVDQSPPPIPTTAPATPYPTRTPEATLQATPPPDPSIAPTPSPTPELTPEPTASPTAEATSSPTAKVTASPKVEPSEPPATPSQPAKTDAPPVPEPTPVPLSELKQTIVNFKNADFNLGYDKFGNPIIKNESKKYLVKGAGILIKANNPYVMKANPDTPWPFGSVISRGGQSDTITILALRTFQLKDGRTAVLLGGQYAGGGSFTAVGQLGGPADKMFLLETNERTGTGGGLYYSDINHPKNQPFSPRELSDRMPYPTNMPGFVLNYHEYLPSKFPEDNDTKRESVPYNVDLGKFFAAASRKGSKKGISTDMIFIDRVPDPDYTGPLPFFSNIYYPHKYN